LKVEKWLFQKIDHTTRMGIIGGAMHNKKGNAVYRRLPYNLVAYDGDMTVWYVEPAYPSDFNKVLDGSGDPIGPYQTDGAGRVVGFEFYDARPFEVFAYNDFDCVNNGGQLP
jgi:hypothetical protein